MAKQRQFRTLRKVKNLIPKGRKQRRQFELFSGATIALAVVIITALSIAPAFQKIVLQSPQTAAVVSAVLVDLLNSDRAENSLGTLTISPKLVIAAQAKADDMAKNGYFSHTSPDGRDSWAWFRQAEYDFNYAGENLAVDFSESGDVERAWMNSPTHRENILNPHFTEIGIATAVGMYQGRLTVFAVQMFGSPKSGNSSAPIEIVSSPDNPEELAVARTSDATSDSSEPEVLSVAAKPISEIESSIQDGESEISERVLGRGSQATNSPAVTQITQDLTSSQLTVSEKPIGAIRTPIPWWGYILSFPKTALMIAYLVIAVFIAISLAWITELEFHIRHIRHATSAAFLFSLMGALFVMSQFVFFVQPVLAAS